MEDYKEGCLMVWAKYMSSCNSIAGLYFKGTCDVISVTMATHKVHKGDGRLQRRMFNGVGKICLLATPLLGYTLRVLVTSYKSP